MPVKRCCQLRRSILLVTIASLVGLYFIITSPSFSVKNSYHLDAGPHFDSGPSETINDLVNKVKGMTGGSVRKIKVLNVLSEYEDDDTEIPKPIEKFQPLNNAGTIIETKHTLAESAPFSEPHPRSQHESGSVRINTHSQHTLDQAVDKQALIHPNTPVSQHEVVNQPIVKPKLIESMGINNARVLIRNKLSPQEQKTDLMNTVDGMLQDNGGVRNTHNDLTSTESRSLSVEDSPNLKSRYGVVLAVNYYEQQTMASRNLFQIQCWAKKLNVAVVKPVTKDSCLLTPLDERLQDSFLKFEDLYDISEWESSSSKYEFAPLLEWGEFLTKAPRNVILVSYNYPSVSVLKARQKAEGKVLHPPEGDRYKSGCETKWPTRTELHFLETHNFKVVRQVCFNFYHGDQLSLETFNSHILGEYSSSEVTIIMDMWRGLGSGQRVLVKDTCTNTYPIQEFIKPSQRLVRDAEAYIETHFSGGPYLAVMGRFEMTLLTVHKKEPIVPYCLRETLSKMQQFRQATDLKYAFLSIDIGKYGSKKWRKNVEPDTMRELQNLIHGIYGDSSSLSDWEITFELYSRDPGYIGLLQKVIVTRAQCVLFTGGGAFQRHALYLYKTLNPSQSSQCLRVIEHCTHSSKFHI